MSLTTAYDVAVVLDGRAVLDGISVAIEPRTQLAVTGRSGSGKTTLLLALAGLLPPTRGRVVLGVPARDIVYVPQAPSLIPELTALDNASLALRVRGEVPGLARDRARHELELLGLADAVEALPAELSGGQQQRVALARALAVRPALLLADEPTGSLDLTTGGLVMDLLVSLATALVVATHDPLVAARLGSGLHLSDGRLQELAA